jgi:hypothetical protein
MRPYGVRASPLRGLPVGPVRPDAMKSPPSLREHILELEERLLRPEVRRSSQALDELFGAEFTEFASDGTAYDKAQVVAALQAEPLCLRSITEFRLVALAEDVVHATYRVTKRGDTSHDSTVSLRSSIWKERDGWWQLIFHQGTTCVTH